MLNLFRNAMYIAARQPQKPNYHIIEQSNSEHQIPGDSDTLSKI